MTVLFGERYAASARFTAVFKEGMALVERTAAYLDGQGRKDARLLKPPVSVVYATESMRLTTRLLELATWLLIRRSLNEGEITQAEAGAKRARVKLRPAGGASHIAHYGELPEGLRSLLEESFRLTDRIIQLDTALGQDPTGIKAAQPNPVAQQIAALDTAFAAGRRSGFGGRRS